MDIHLAPLENVSCFAFRKLAHGATDTYTGMLSLNTLLRRNNAWKELDTYPIKDQRQWVQVATAKETECRQFLARLDAELSRHSDKNNIHGIQLNASCPSPQLIRTGQGPALIKRATKVSHLLGELLNQNRFAVSIKVRLGLNQHEVTQRKLLTLFEHLETISGLAHAAVHFKHAQQTSAEPYEYTLLGELAQFNVPLVINGGITTADDFRTITANVAQKNIKGLMVGRAFMNDPNTIATLSNDLRATRIPLRSTAQLRAEFTAACQQHEPLTNYKEKITKYCPWAKRMRTNDY